MSDNLEIDFSKAVKKIKRKRISLFLKRMGLFSLGILALVLLIKIYPPALAAVMLFLGLTSLAYYLHRSKLIEQSYYRFRHINAKYFLGFAVLILAIAYENNAYSINNYLTALAHNPKPNNTEISLWKNSSGIHSIIEDIKPENEKSIKSVAQYIAQKEPDPFLRIKAIHDYVIKKVDYDIEVLKTGIRPPQGPQTVFVTGKAVCEGYANLFQAMAQEMKIDTVVVGGVIRRDLAPLDIIPQPVRSLKTDYNWTLHAWNAVKVKNNWYLVDVTWDDTQTYNTSYLMLPPKVMIISHLPHAKQWQLLNKTLIHKDFENQPLLEPAFFSENLEMISPRHYTTKVNNRGVIEIKSPPNDHKKIVALFAKTEKQDPR